MWNNVEPIRNNVATLCCAKNCHCEIIVSCNITSCCLIIRSMHCLTNNYPMDIIPWYDHFNLLSSPFMLNYFFTMFIKSNLTAFVAGICFVWRTDVFVFPSFLPTVLPLIFAPSLHLLNKTTCYPGARNLLLP